MDVIITHDGTDFDGFASAIAATKLYPDAVVVLGRAQSSELRAFLALHRDRFPFTDIEHVDPDRVRRLIVVDVRRANRLARYGRLIDRARNPDDPLEVHVYDHHAAAEDDLDGSVVVVQPVGSATTLLVEEMRRRGIQLDGAEATLLALGIHTDTGSLTHGNTDGRDATALGWLLEQGANLPVIARYVRTRLSPPQRRAAAALLDHTEHVRIRGLEVAVARATVHSKLGNLADVTSQAAQLDGAPAFFALFECGPAKVQVVARATTPLVHVGEVLSALGGGGHEGAASAKLRSTDVEVARQRLIEALRSQVRAPTRVLEVMSSPVRGIGPEASLDELRARLDAVHGLPVLDDGALVGVVSRRDLDEARSQRRPVNKVKSIMSRRPLTIDADASVERALALMTEHDVGRLPVLRGEHVVGIVARSDVLRVLYQPEPDVSSP